MPPWNASRAPTCRSHTPSRLRISPSLSIPTLSTPPSGPLTARSKSLASVVPLRLSPCRSTILQINCVESTVESRRWQCFCLLGDFLSAQSARLATISVSVAISGCLFVPHSMVPRKEKVISQGHRLKLLHFAHSNYVSTRLAKQIRRWPPFLVLPATICG